MGFRSCTGCKYEGMTGRCDHCEENNYLFEKRAEIYEFYGEVIQNELKEYIIDEDNITIILKSLMGKRVKIIIEEEE